VSVDDFYPDAAIRPVCIYELAHRQSADADSSSQPQSAEGLIATFGSARQTAVRDITLISRNSPLRRNHIHHRAPLVQILVR
jgi:hypothetical protein